MKKYYLVGISIIFILFIVLSVVDAYYPIIFLPYISLLIWCIMILVILKITSGRKGVGKIIRWVGVSAAGLIILMDTIRLFKVDDMYMDILTGIIANPYRNIICNIIFVIVAVIVIFSILKKNMK